MSEVTGTTGMIPMATTPEPYGNFGTPGHVQHVAEIPLPDGTTVGIYVEDSDGHRLIGTTLTIDGHTSDPAYVDDATAGLLIAGLAAARSRLRGAVGLTTST